MTFYEWAVRTGYTLSDPRAWDSAEAGWNAARAECAKVAGESLILVPFTGEHEKSVFGRDMAKAMAEEIVRRIEDIG